MAAAGEAAVAAVAVAVVPEVAVVVLAVDNPSVPELVAVVPVPQFDEFLRAAAVEYRQ